MLRLRAIGCCALLFLLMGCWGGCVQGDSRLDEEKDPHFQRGRSLTSSQEFKRAAEEFEKALDANPRSAAAHFELGWLYDTKLNDYAAAIYHYQKHLELRPDSERAALVKDRIRGCKQELANTEFPLPNSKNLQKEVDRLNAENQALKQQIEVLNKQLALAPPSSPAQAAPVATRYAAVQPATTTAAPTHAAEAALSSHARVHIVRSRETIFSIASEYHVRSSAILAANPQIDPRHLRVGQSLNLP
jgi:tetratricopeptide (TPR) repeat protein